MSDFEFPTNIKQIGSIGEGTRIYMEDYVCTFLQQYAESAGYEERLALLIGRTLVIDGQRVLFISGAVQGVDTVSEKGVLNFTDESFDYAQEQIERYFYGLEIVGFMQSQPSYGTMLNAGYANYHIKTFPNAEQVMFVLDPIEKLTAFYVYNEAEDALEEAEGYFIYYDKNRGMHEYMVNNKLVKLKVLPHAAEEIPGVKPQHATTPNEIRTRLTEPVVRSSGRRPAKNAIHIEEKKVINMLVSLSAVLVLVCFVMGAGLVRSDSRIATLEAEFLQIGNTYKSLVAQLGNGGTASVFAQTDTASSDVSAAALPTPVAQADTSDETQSTFELVPVLTPVPATPVPTQVPMFVATPEPTDVPVPSIAPVVVYPNVPDTYTVEQGDTLSFISRKFYGDSSMTQRIMEVNGMTDPDKLLYGTIIKLPKY